MRDGDEIEVLAVNGYYPFGFMMEKQVFQGNDRSHRFGFNGKENDDEIKGKGIMQDYGFRIYRNELGRFLTPDPLITFEKMYPELSPYQFASNTPIWAIDLDGLEARVYTETKSLGHTFLTVGTGKDMIVYTYGRYAEVKDKSSARSTALYGEGVLVKLTGPDAHQFVQEALFDKDAKVFEIQDADENIIIEFFNSKFDSSDQLPSKGKYKNSPNARVIDSYSLLDNNCTTITCNALQEGGSNVTNLTRTIVTGSGFTVINSETIQQDFAVPLLFQSYLHSKIDNVKDLTNQMKEEIKPHLKEAAND